MIQTIKDYFQNYSRLPTKNEIELDLSERTDVTEEDFKETKDILVMLDDKKDGLENLLEKTEEWCKTQALHNAIRDSIAILTDDSKGKGEIPKLVAEALSVSFSQSIGHDYFDDAKERYKFYHRTEYRIPFNLRDFDRLTKNGLAKKTMTVFLAGTNVGKSLIMCHLAGNALRQGKNVLYITLEMAREKIAQRIDANLLDVTVNDLEGISEDLFESKVEKLKSRCKTGKLIIEEYPPTTAGISHFRHLLTELKLKKGFVPDIIFIDYINLALSSRLKMSSNITSYAYIKAVAEEFRSLCVEFDLPLVTATQLNRKGFASDEPGMEDTSESFGLPMTADLLFVVTTNDILKQQKKLLVKDAKNRDNETGSSFLIGVDYPHMRLYDVDEDEQLSRDPTNPTEIYKTVGNRIPVNKLFDMSLDKGPINTFGSNEPDPTEVMNTWTKEMKKQNNKDMNTMFPGDWSP